MRLMASTRRIRALVLPAIVSVGVAACTSGPVGGAPAANGNASRASAQPHAAQPVTATPATVVVDPADNANGVRPDATVQVKASSGSLASVTIQKVGTAQPLSGILSRSRVEWSAVGSLDLSSSYVIKATATNAAGQVTTTTSSFQTVRPADRLITSATPGDGQTVGVGMPIRLRFNNGIPDAQKPGVLAHIAVISNPVQAGGWYWFSDSEVHYRPQQYWQSGTTVNLVAQLNGVDAGNGVWGQGNWSESFSIGTKHVSIIDAAAHSMTVYANDQPVNTWPVSTGKPSLQTISGTLVVWYKTPDVLMDSLGLGIPRNAPDGYYEHVYQDVAISTDGFYIHSAPWSVWAQGYRNVSHGCVNLSPGRAASFYSFSQPGDVVVVKNTTRPASADDGEGDWQTDFSKFVAGGQAVTGV
jgi:lipoprotein-anchoring transpeptidase ErfK/SrfK